jgi:protein phosphatase
MRIRQNLKPATFEVGAVTDIGRLRQNNEDSLAVRRIDGGGGLWQLWVVADGIGGGMQGELASELAVNAVVEHLSRGRWTDPGDALAAAFAVANRRVRERAASDGLPTAMGSTLVAALVAEDRHEAYLANVGDSRAYLISRDAIRPLTEDHSLAAAQVAVGKMSEAEAERSMIRHILTRGIGVEEHVTADVFGPVALGAGDRLLLCTDGLHGMLSDGEIGRVAHERPTSELAEALVEAANAAGGRDNVTVIVGGAVAQAA